MGDNKHTVSVMMRENISPEEAAHYLESARRRAGNAIYEILYSQKLPAVVDIEEITIPPKSFAFPYGELRIEITVTPVQHRSVTVFSGAGLDLKDNSNKKSLWERLTAWMKR